MNIEVKLVPGLIIEGFDSGYSRIVQWKLVKKDENYKEMNYATGEEESLWEVSRGNCTQWMFEDEIMNHYWVAGENQNIDYRTWSILKV